MKRLLSLTLIAFLLMSSSPVFSATNPKFGDPCPKFNLEKTYQYITYVCLKVNGKLVWTGKQYSDKAENQIIPTKTNSKDLSINKNKKLKYRFIEGETCDKMGIQKKFTSFTLECRNFSNHKLKFVKLSSNFNPISNPSSPESPTFCRISDMRTQIPENTYAIAYPPKPFRNYTPTGQFKVVVVGIDFSDVPGTGSPADLWNEDLKKTSEWLKWYTNDKVKFNFFAYPQWFRAPKTSGNYDATNHGPKAPEDVQSGGLTSQNISEDYVHSIEKSVDLSGVNTIWFYFPHNIKKIIGQWTLQTAHVQTEKYGVINPHLIAVGADTYESKRVRWGYFLHEMIHGFGLQGHSPKYLPANGFTRIGEMSTADGWTNALLPWDALTWGVDKPEDTFCIDKGELSSIELKLVPLEREQTGYRSAMVRLNDHQVLIVESHRSDKWGIGEGPGFAGVMVTLIDTTISTSWDNDVTATNSSTTSTGKYLTVDGANHGIHKPIGLPNYVDGKLYGGVGVVNGQGIAGDFENWDLNHIMYTGESITNSGVKITLQSGGDNDIIRIEKN